MLLVLTMKRTSKNFFFSEKKQRDDDNGKKVTTTTALLSMLKNIHNIKINKTMRICCWFEAIDFTLTKRHIEREDPEKHEERYTTRYK